MRGLSSHSVLGIMHDEGPWLNDIWTSLFRCIQRSFYVETRLANLVVNHLAQQRFYLSEFVWDSVPIEICCSGTQQRFPLHSLPIICASGLAL